MGVIIIGAFLILFFGSDNYHKINTLKKGTVINKVGAKGKVTYEVTGKYTKNWVSLREINYQAMRAIQISEDWMFFAHQGLDFVQLSEAIKETLESRGRKVRGASTISQQVAKNLFTDKERSLKRKAQELVWTLVMEWKLPKVKILEIYLNIAEMGPGIYGIRQASQYYFQKSPRQLNPREGAFLAMLLPNPKRYSQSFRDKRLTRFARRLVSSILLKLRQEGVLSESEYATYSASQFSWEIPDNPVDPQIPEDVEYQEELDQN